YFSPYGDSPYLSFTSIVIVSNLTIKII
ncbi:hypothetical protein A2U01_0091735, partial [Trifolium medium]|nr:hypothetical protein [Trifolium medium]